MLGVGTRRRRGGAANFLPQYWLAVALALGVYLARLEGGRAQLPCNLHRLMGHLPFSGFLDNLPHSLTAV